MGLYVIERNFAEQLDPELLDRDGIRLVNDDVGVRWIYSFLSADKKKTYCLYEAPSAEAIREAAARARHPRRRDRRRRADRTAASPTALTTPPHRPSTRSPPSHGRSGDSA